MSTLVYSEPYKLSAGALALLVHSIFFILLYFGFSWQMQPPQGMVVDIWESLPQSDASAAASPEPAPPVQAVRPEPPAPPKAVARAEPSKAEIEMAAKKKKKKQKEEKEEAVAKLTAKQLAAQKAAYAKRLQQESEQQAREAERQAEIQAQAAATGRVVDEFKAKIEGKIRRNIVLPPGVSSKIRAEFDVTLLPGGQVMEARLTRSSGSNAYDSAVERAILKSQPLPLPPDASLFNKFRDLHLGFSPGQQGG